MEINFTFVGKERRSIKNLLFEISFNSVTDKEVQLAVIAKYSKELVRRLDLRKITLVSKKQRNHYQYKLIFRGSPASDEASLMTYLAELGFTQIKSLAEFNHLETETLQSITSNMLADQTAENRMIELDSLKQIISKGDYQKMYARLFTVRDEIEQLYYQTGEEREELMASLAEIDFLLDNKKLFVTDCAFFYLISGKVKKRLAFYSRYLENMRYGN